MTASAPAAVRPDDLVSLLTGVAAKNDAAFQELYAATKRKLFATVLPIVRRRQLAEEVVQEAFVRIWLNAAQYTRSRGSPMVWMMAIARNLAIDVARRPIREISSDQSLLSNFAAEGPTALEIIEIRESEGDTVRLQQSIFSALEALEPTRRQLVIAAYLHGENRDRLSERYGVPVNTIKTWIRRALLEVRAKIGTAPASYDAGGLLAGFRLEQSDLPRPAGRL